MASSKTMSLFLTPESLPSLNLPSKTNDLVVPSHCGGISKRSSSPSSLNSPTSSRKKMAGSYLLTCWSQLLKKVLSGQLSDQSIDRQTILTNKSKGSLMRENSLVSQLMRTRAATQRGKESQTETIDLSLTPKTGNTTSSTKVGSKPSTSMAVSPLKISKVVSYDAQSSST